MKNIKNIIPEFKKDNNVIVHKIKSGTKIIKLDEETNIDKLVCPDCQQKNWLTCWDTTEKELKVRIALCISSVCLASVKRSHVKEGNQSSQPKRALEWPSFCETNEIGDEHFNVTFEGIEQSGKFKTAIKNFAESPSGILLMLGKKGTGKTYAAHGICEYVIRKNAGVRFYSQQRLSACWLDSLKNSLPYDFKNMLCNLYLLVIDDFATYEPPAGFMAFFADIIDYRLQYRKRGTVITSNLTIEKLSNISGDFLSDRLRTGVLLEFKGESRRG